MNRAQPEHRPHQTASTARRPPPGEPGPAVGAEFARGGERPCFVPPALRHPTATALRRATVARWQQSAGNARVARAIGQSQDAAKIPAGPAPLGQVQRTVIQRITFDVAKDRLKRAGSGWGTDEEAIYAAIRECNDRPRLKTDPDVQRLLASEMKGHELWKAQLLIEYGTEAAYPDAVKEIWAATNRGGANKERIYKVLQKLSATDANLIALVPGLRDMLKKKLLGNNLVAANELLAGNYATAIAQHKANVAVVKALLTAMKQAAMPAKVRNTAEWLEPSGGGVPTSDLFVLTPTHDAAARAKKHGHQNEIAYFGDRPKYPDDKADYDPHINSERNIHYMDPSVGGEQLDRNVWVYSPRAVTLQEVLTHEIQHAADRHDREEGYGARYKSPQESWHRYKMEFRAYWMDGTRDLMSTAPGTATNPLFDNDKQHKIFLHMWGPSEKDVYAVWLRPNYKNNTTVDGQKFQDLVHNYKTAEGVNLVNSPRINDFYTKLDRCRPRDTNLAAAPLKDLAAAATAFDADDRTAINATDARRLQEMMKDHLGPAALTHIATIVNGGAAPVWLSDNIAQARKAIIDAGKGWSVDDRKIYDAIAKASPAERTQMKTDPAVRQVLFTEFRGGSLWKALLMLEYGPRSQWPAEIGPLWDATQRAGTDEKAIRATLQKLTRAQVEALARVEGLRDMLNADLSGQDQKTTDELLSGVYADAVAKHEREIVTVENVIQAGLTGTDATWQAICAKLNDPAKASIYVMTLTHDTRVRAAKAGHAGKEAYFGADAAYPSSAARYDSLPTSNHRILFMAPGTTPVTHGRTLYIYNASTMTAAVLRTNLETFGKTLP